MSDIVGMELRYTLEGRPVPWQRARSNGRQRWSACARCARCIRGSVLATSLVARIIAWPRDARYELEVIAFCAPVQRGDSDNYAKLVAADALQGSAYDNDRQLVEVRGRREVDRDRPRTEVVLRVIEPAPATRPRSRRAAKPRRRSTGAVS